MARSGLLIDWGGVLTTNLFGSFTAFCQAENLRPEAVRDAFRSDPEGTRLLVEFECGRLDEAEFERGLAGVLGLDRHEGMIARLFGGMSADEHMMAAVRAFKQAGVKTGLLSNSWGAGSYDRSLFAELFDVLIISGEENMRKPDPAIYDLAAERMGLPPDELVFVDDLPGNLKPARAIGIATVHHQEAATTIPSSKSFWGSPSGPRRRRPAGWTPPDAPVGRFFP